MFKKLKIESKLRDYCECTLNSYIAFVELTNGEIRTIGHEMINKYSEMDKDGWVCWLYSKECLKVDGGAYVNPSKILKIFDVRKEESIDTVINIWRSFPTSKEAIAIDSEAHKELLMQLNSK